MSTLKLTNHALVRMAQRAIKDPELIEMIGTEVDGGFLITDKDLEELSENFKAIIDRVRRLRGTRLIVVEGRVVTAYRTSIRIQQNLIRGRNSRSAKNRTSSWYAARGSVYHVDDSEFNYQATRDGGDPPGGDLGGGPT